VERLPLEGVRVVEFTHMVMGPTCGMVLADLGAEVVRVEPPGGDPTRRLPGIGIGFWRTFNRNKKSVVLDLHDADDRATARALVGTADVLVENFRPGLMASWGLDHASLAPAHPRLVYASHKGFLPGPYDRRLALDEVVQMMGGLAYMTGPPGRPLRAGASVNDIMGGMFGAIGVLAALRERERTGRGGEVQSALFENCAFLCASHVEQARMTGERPPPMPARVSSWAVYDVFALAGDEQLFVGAVSDKQFRALCGVLGAPGLVDVPAYATNTSRVAARSTLMPTLAALLSAHRAADLMPRLEAAGVPFAPIATPDRLVDDPHLLASGGLVPIGTDDGGTSAAVLLPIALDGHRFGVRRPLARAGEHDAEVLGALVGQPAFLE
jgi:crotonobetainyl-CoA:carnitine CoA-transferase CaiB-like acyl-CoA transferase